MNDNPNNTESTASEQSLADMANSSYLSNSSSDFSGLGDNGLSRYFGEFFDKCRRISETERTINDALGIISQFKPLLSRALKRPIETQDDLKNGIDEITPILEFWAEYGERFKSFVHCDDDAQRLLDYYRQYPDLEQKIAQLQVNVKEASLRNEAAELKIAQLQDAVKVSEAQIATLQENEITKQLTETQKQLADEKEKNAELTKKNNEFEMKLGHLEDELSCSRTENQRITDEAESLKDRLAQEQSSHQDEIERATNAYRSKSEKVEQLQTEIMTYQIIRGLIADAFKIDTRTESEYTRALKTAKTILRACVEMGKNNPLDDNIIERIEDILKENARLRDVEEANKKNEDTIAKLQNDLSKKDADLFDKEQRISDSNEIIAKKSDEIAKCQQRISDLDESERALQRKVDKTLSSLEIRDRIIQCFQDISDDIDAIVNAIENTENGADELPRLKSILKELCIQNNRMVDIDEIAKAEDIASIDNSSIKKIFNKFKAFDKTKKLHDIYLGFINSLMKIRGMQWSSTTEPQAQERILETFSIEYTRVLTMCRTFDDFKHSRNAEIDLERLEAHQAEMFLALENFYQYARKSTNDPTFENGTTLYEKVVPLPNVQEQLSRTIETAIFSINFTSAKVDECEKLHNSLNELQLQYEKQSNVLGILEKKIYPNFMTSQNPGRRDKLIDDIEFGLANDSVQALPLKSYLGLLSFVEKDNDTISDETLIWILQQLPKALYNFYQDTILEGATDISSDEVIYDVMNQLMNKINKFILKGSFFLSMPRLGSSISLDSMDVVETTNSVNAVLSWMISDARHKIIHKALVK